MTRDALFLFIFPDESHGIEAFAVKQVCRFAHAFDHLELSWHDLALHPITLRTHVAAVKLHRGWCEVFCQYGDAFWLVVIVLVGNDCLEILSETSFHEEVRWVRIRHLATVWGAGDDLSIGLLHAHKKKGFGDDAPKPFH